MSISIIDIKNTLSEITYNLGRLCKSNKINKWSFRKPINKSKMSVLNDDDYYSVDDGFILRTYNQPQEMMYALQDPDTDLWSYEDRDTPYRLSDFSQYMHNAPVMFELDFVNLNTGTFGDTLRISCSTDIQNVVNNWATPQPLSSTGDLVLLIFERDRQYDQSGMGGIGVYKICQLMNLDTEHINFEIPASTEIQTGEYTLVPCISTATYRLNDGEYYYYNNNAETWYGQWFPFPPHSKLNFSITQTSPSHVDFFPLFDFTDFEAVDFNYTPSNYELRDITFTNYITHNPYNATRQFSVTIEYYYTNCAQPVLLGQAYRTFSNDNTFETVSINYRDTITVITGARLEDDIITIEQRVRISSLGDTQTQIYTRTLEKS